MLFAFALSAGSFAFGSDQITNLEGVEVWEVRPKGDGLNKCECKGVCLDIVESGEMTVGVWQVARGGGLRGCALD